MTASLSGKLLALDVDGTLLRRDGSLSGRTVEAVTAAAEVGAVLTLATGRDWAAVRDLLARLEAVQYSLCINGIEVFRADGYELHATELDPRAAVEAVHALRDAIPGVAIGAGVRGDLVGEPAINDTMPEGVADTVVVDDIVAVIGPGVRDLVIYHPDHARDLDAFHATVSAVVPTDRLDVAFTGLPMIELVPPGSGKDRGLAWLADHVGIARVDVVAFGDGLNDLSMLRWAGHGVAMGHAPDAVRQVADEVTLGNDDDGLAVWIERRLPR